MFVWRKMEGVVWSERVTNEEVLHRVGERRTLLEVIRSRKHRWAGHILRGDGLTRLCFEGRMEGKRGRGRKRQMLLDDVGRGFNYGQLKRKAEDRRGWRGMIKPA